MSETSDRTGPILILGLLPRCGTNFVKDLLDLHPGTAFVSPIFEDHLLRHAGHLVEYADSVYAHWRRKGWPVGGEHRERLLRSLGGGLEEYLFSLVGPGRRPLTKSTSVERLESLFRIFPTAQAVIVVRDGRAVAESGSIAFDDWSVDLAARWWADAVEALLAFEEAAGELRHRWHVVRYEDLYAERRDQLPKLLERLGLDHERYPFAESERIPVRGSCSFRGGADAVHWRPVPRTDEFQPLERWSHWGPDEHLSFDRIAGSALAALGYEPLGEEPADASPEPGRNAPEVG